MNGVAKNLPGVRVRVRLRVRVRVRVRARARVNGVAKNLPSSPTHGGVEPKLWHCRPVVPLGKACVHWARAAVVSI